MLHPEVATRDCPDCALHVYDEKLGTVRTHGGQPLKRPPGTLPPCRTAARCAKGTPEASRSLSDKNMKAYLHYLECKATGSFPDDPLVRRNAACIRQVEESCERLLADRSGVSLLTALTSRR